MALEVFDKLSETNKELLKLRFEDRVCFYDSFSDGFRTYHIPVSYVVNDVPFSNKLKEIKRKSFSLGVIVFIIVAVLLSLIKINLLLSLIVAYIVKRVASKIYTKIHCMKNKDTIEREIEESKIILSNKKQEVEKQRQFRLERLIKWHSSRTFPKLYRNIIEKVKNENILLYEYYSYDYPPDWEYRSEITKKRDGFRCVMCGKPYKLCVHHKKPVKMGGDHFLSNLVTLCNECHIKQHPSLLRKICVDTNRLLLIV